jgi:hypothetical protein
MVARARQQPTPWHVPTILTGDQEKAAMRDLLNALGENYNAGHVVFQQDELLRKTLQGVFRIDVPPYMIQQWRQSMATESLQKPQQPGKETAPVSEPGDTPKGPENDGVCADVVPLAVDRVQPEPGEQPAPQILPVANEPEADAQTLLFRWPNLECKVPATSQLDASPALSAALQEIGVTMQNLLRTALQDQARRQDHSHARRLTLSGERELQLKTLRADLDKALLTIAQLRKELTQVARQTERNKNVLQGVGRTMLELSDARTLLEFSDSGAEIETKRNEELNHG